MDIGFSDCQFEFTGSFASFDTDIQGPGFIRPVREYLSGTVYGSIAHKCVVYIYADIRSQRNRIVYLVVEVYRRILGECVLRQGRYNNRCIIQLLQADNFVIQSITPDLLPVDFRNEVTFQFMHPVCLLGNDEGLLTP